MKQCISRIITKIIHLWRTFSKYVCRKQTVTEDGIQQQLSVDIDHDGQPDVILRQNIRTNDSKSMSISNDSQWYSELEPLNLVQNKFNEKEEN